VDRKTDLPTSACCRAIRCAQIVHENRGRDIVILEMRELVHWVDYLVIATGTSRRQITTIADRIEDAMRDIGERRLGIEGYHQGSWVVLDYGDVVVHIFNDEKRHYYQLEHLWADAPRIDWQPATIAAP
jgi:ribosome-associated protein